MFEVLNAAAKAARLQCRAESLSFWHPLKALRVWQARRALRKLQEARSRRAAS